MTRELKDVSEFDTLDEYKADIRAKLEAQAAERDNNNFTNAVIEKVLENAEVMIPEAMIERQIDSMMRDFEYRLMGNGLKLDDFIKYTGSDMQAFRENYRGQAIKSVKAHLVLEAIEKAEAIDATEEQIAEYKQKVEAGSIRRRSRSRRSPRKRKNPAAKAEG